VRDAIDDDFVVARRRAHETRGRAAPDSHGRGGRPLLGWRLRARAMREQASDGSGGKVNPHHLEVSNVY
jgi:hypothetical protein